MTSVTYDIEIQPGETLRLPQTVMDQVGAGRWRITIAPLAELDSLELIRGHTAFLSGYEPADEGLYDDYPAR